MTGAVLDPGDLGVPRGRSCPVLGESGIRTTPPPAGARMSWPGFTGRAPRNWEEQRVPPEGSRRRYPCGIYLQ